jgi:cobalt/nickel transport system permease protein
MHIPDGFLDPKVSTGLVGAAAAVLAYSFAKVRDLVTALAPAEALATVGNGFGNIVGRMRRVLTGEGERLIYKMGMVAVLVFAVQMFDFTITAGATGHIMGGMLAALILGPFAGTIVMSAVLVVQAFFLADGGVLALGANIVSIALFGTLLAYYIYDCLKRVVSEWFAIVVAAWISLPLAAFACALEIGFSGKTPFNIIIPAMIRVHVITGVAEALFTLSLINLYRQILTQKN